MAVVSLSKKRTSARLSGSLVETLVLAIPLILLMVFLLVPVLVVMTLGLAVGPGSTFIDTMLLPVTHNVIAFTLYQALLSTCLSVIKNQH
jgi:ABC-type Fe3+ transport system permease subunit